MIIGTPIKIEPAANLVNLVSSSDISPIATVQRFLSLSRSFGRIKITPGPGKTVSALYTQELVLKVAA